MSRSLRLQFPGALYHIHARGNAKQTIFLDDRDRRIFLNLLGSCVARCGWILTAYVLMRNHYHLVVKLTAETLSKGMHWLDGEYARLFNRRHRRVGHLFQGRPKVHLVEEETYFQEVVRYVILNPVRAGLVKFPDDYEWSSHRAVLGLVRAPQWLAVDDVLASFGPRRQMARDRYREFVDVAVGLDINPWPNLVGQMYLGSEQWVERMREKVDLQPRADAHPREQKLLHSTPMAAVVAAVAHEFGISDALLRYGRGGTPRTVAAWIGWNEALLSGPQIAAGLRLRGSGSVTRLVQACERDIDSDPLVRQRIDRCVSTMRRERKNGSCDPIT